MRAVILALLLTACGDAAQFKAPEKPVVAPPLPPPADRLEPPARPDRSGLADMSPRQRRAFDEGYRDCRAGRYDAARQGEAYRIGCAAAQE